MPESASVKSPCVNICALDENDVCTGCYRSAAEIGAWTGLSNEQKRTVVVRAEQRYREAWSPRPASRG